MGIIFLEEIVDVLVISISCQVYQTTNYENIWPFIQERMYSIIDAVFNFLKKTDERY